MISMYDMFLVLCSLAATFLIVYISYKKWLEDWMEGNIFYAEGIVLSLVSIAILVFFAVLCIVYYIGYGSIEPLKNAEFINLNR